MGFGGENKLTSFLGWLNDKRRQIFAFYTFHCIFFGVVVFRCFFLVFFVSIQLLCCEDCLW